MREVLYKKFSLSTHQRQWHVHQPNICQFELTFKCGLHCRHCYTDCYNHRRWIKKELRTEQVKTILDKIFHTGILWLCLTGGDPLTRPDFLTLYAYAKKKGFIVTVFTNACSMDERIAAFLQASPPFVIEITLNGVTAQTYEKITQVPGSFQKAMQGIARMVKKGLPFKIKTQATKDNFHELPMIKKFVEGLGLSFTPTVLMHGRLNGDAAPCNLRIPLPKLKIFDPSFRLSSPVSFGTAGHLPQGNLQPLFPCAVAGGDGVMIDPCGNMFLCELIRRPRYNLLQVDLREALDRALSAIRKERFRTPSRCRGCSIRDLCRNCPGRAYLECGDKEAPIAYYCRLAHALADQGRRRREVRN